MTASLLIPAHGAAGGAPDRPVMLVCELLGPSPFRHHRNELFPFVLGLCDLADLRARWTIVAVDASDDALDRFVVDLGPDDRERLVRELSSAGASHLLVNESLAPELRAFVRDAVPGLHLVCVGDLPREEQEALKTGSVGRLLSFLELDPAEVQAADPARLLLDAVAPSYRRAPPSDPDARRLVLLKILLHAECAYRRPLAINPFFDGLDLGGASHDRGCSFCRGGAVSARTWPYETPALDLALVQIERAVEAVREEPALGALHSPREDARLHFLIQGAVAFHRLDAFLERIAAVQIPPSAFLFSCRADELVAKGPVIERWLPELERLGHALHLWVIGVENFAEAENARFNKHIEPAQILECHRMMSRWERDHRETFCFSRYGGFSFILFTPWTTLEDLRTNLAWARAVGIEPRGFFLRSRVQLVDGMPISLLARRDGLVVDRFSEPYFDSGCIQSQHERELSWRFRHADVAAIHRVASRLAPEVPGLGGDPLYARVQEALAPERARGLDAFDAFEALLDVVEERGAEGPDDAERLVDALKARLSATAPQRAERASGDGLALAAALADRALADPALAEAGRLVRAYLAAHHAELPYAVARMAEKRRADGTLELRLDLTAPGDELFRASIEPRVAGRNYLAATARWGIAYAADTPPDTVRRRALLRSIERALAGAGPAMGPTL